MSPAPRGKNLPSQGKLFPKQPDDYRMVIAQALRRELGNTRHAAKTVMRWTGAGERTVKNWLAGTFGPQGKHLLGLMRHSDNITETVLLLTGRQELANRVKARAPHPSPRPDQRSDPLSQAVRRWAQAREIRDFADAAERYRAATMDPDLRDALLRLSAEARVAADQVDPLRLPIPDGSLR